MKFRVGQKVRQLRHSGDGVITALIDGHTVEVDFGDGFGIDVDVEDIIPVDLAESTYLGGDRQGSSTYVHDPSVRKPLQLGSALVDLSLVFLARPEDRFQLVLANPEPTQLLYALYLREQNRYYGLASGVLESGTVQEIGLVTGAELQRTRSFYAQVLHFVPGKGHPHTPLLSEIPWTKNALIAPPRFLEAVGESAWVFSMRQDAQKNAYDNLDDREFIRLIREEQPAEEVHLEVDLHLEELVDDAGKILPGEALRIQMEEVARALSNALLRHAASLVLIHGVGEGKLKQEVHLMLKRTPHVKSFGPADARKYGSGATKVVFK